MSSQSISFLKGDATSPQTDGCKIIAHVCNDIGGWGKGIVLAISSRWKEPEEQYRKWYQNRDGNDFALGSTQLVKVDRDLYIANMVGQHGIKSRSKSKSNEPPPIRYEALNKCLASLGTTAEELSASVHMPRIGCGLAGGKWDLVEPLITSQLCTRGIPVYVYDLE